MTQFMLLSILAIAGIGAQPLLFSRESLETGQERTGDQLTAMKLETAAVPVGLKYVVCPGGRYQCRDGQTCCRSGDKWACCPYPKAVCCRDQKHCCPQGKTCDLTTGKCSGGDFQPDWSAKEPAVPLSTLVEQNALFVVMQGVKSTPQSTTGTAQDTPCGGERFCPNTYPICCNVQKTCCKSNYPVCCSDGKTCCPPGSYCVFNECRRNFVQLLKWIAKESVSPAKTVKEQHVETGSVPEKQPESSVGNVPCGGGYACPDGHTCCKSGKEWKCCPSPKAVCCTDGKHCCPNGTSCDPSTGSCKPRDVWMGMLKQVPAKEESKSQNLDPLS